MKIEFFYRDFFYFFLSQAPVSKCYLDGDHPLVLKVKCRKFHHDRNKIVDLLEVQTNKQTNGHSFYAYKIDIDNDDRF